MTADSGNGFEKHSKTLDEEFINGSNTGSGTWIL